MTRTPTSSPPVPAVQQKGPPLLERIVAASSSFGDLTKDSKNDYLRSSYLALPGLLKAIKEPLLGQGVAIYTQLIKAGDSFLVRTTLSLMSGDEEISSDFPVFDASNMHKIGAAVTYGTRYNLLALLAICPESDDDGAAAVYGGASMAPTGLPGMPAGWLPGGVMPMQQPPPPVPAMANPVQPTPVLPQ